MRESNQNLDSLSTVDATHLHPTSQPGAQTPEVQNFSVSPATTVLHSHNSESQANGAIPDQSPTRDDGDAIAPAMSDAWRDRVLTWLQAHVPENRLQHILRVEQMSVELAQLHHLNCEQAAQAGLLHDLAKFFKPQRLLEMAQAEGLELDPVDVASPHLLHADVGAIVARDEFGTRDTVVLDAIRHHTLGQPGMSALSCVVFLADSLEPGRGDTPELTELRQISQYDLHRAVWQTCDYSLRYLMSSSRLVHPRMILTRNWALLLAQQRSQAHPAFPTSPMS